jgi:hypothetical protein
MTALRVDGMAESLIRKRKQENKLLQKPITIVYFFKTSLLYKNL